MGYHPFFVLPNTVGQKLTTPHFRILSLAPFRANVNQFLTESFKIGVFVQNSRRFLWNPCTARCRCQYVTYLVGIRYTIGYRSVHDCGCQISVYRSDWEYIVGRGLAPAAEKMQLIFSDFQRKYCMIALRAM